MEGPPLQRFGHFADECPAGKLLRIVLRGQFFLYNQPMPEHA